MDPCRHLREIRYALAADPGLRGRAFGVAWSEQLDAALRALLHDLDGRAGRAAVVALGSYGRRELCPGSDVDVLLLIERDGADGREVAERLWYPLWDAGVVLGHAVRTPRQARRAADADPQALTALIDGRVVGGSLAGEATELLQAARRLAVARRDVLVRVFVDDRERRRLGPGSVAERLEPDLKDGIGGLRDIQALGWIGWCLGEPGGLAALEAYGYLGPDDPGELAAAADRLLEVRVALHRATGGASDLLTLEQQDDVATQLGEPDPAGLVRDLAGRARRVAWITTDCLDRLRATQRGPFGRRSGRDRTLGPGVLVRDGRVRLRNPERAEAADVLRAARLAALAGRPLDRHQLATVRLEPPRWDARLRAELLALLGVGPALCEAVEVLDHLGLFEVVLPEWATVRALPQRNPYHTWTVDRHLLQTVVEAASLLGGTGGPHATVARSCRRPDLLLLGALFHDIGKGSTLDHSELGASVADEVAARIGLDTADRATLRWLVRDHLHMAEVATRRDLEDPATIRAFATRVGDLDRLVLLYLLTVADSRATGPAAWSVAKGALLAECYARTADLLAGGAERPALEPAEVTVTGEATVDWECLDPGHLRCRVVATDRPGLLAAVAGALALAGLDVVSATARTTSTGVAVETFTGLDPGARLGRPEDRAAASGRILDAIAGRSDPAADLVRRRASRWRRRGDDGVRVEVVPGVSASATVVEVHAPNTPGLLARLAGAFAAAGADVRVAKAATFGDRVVDTFYVRGADGRELDDTTLAMLVERLTGAAGPGSPAT